MHHRSSSIPILLIGLFLTACALIGLYLGDLTLFDSRAFTLTTPEGDRLNGTYFPGSQDGSVLLVEGLDSDQVAMRSLANEFNNAGFNVFTFDFPGQGASSGGLSFDDTQTDRLANLVLLVEKNIPSISGRTDQPLIVVGHNLGGRAALQAAVLDSSPIKGLVLIGPQLNLLSSQKNSLFTSVDDNSLPWFSQLKLTIPKTRILILSSSTDDVFNFNSGSLLLQALTDDPEAKPITSTNSFIPDGGPQWMVIPDQVNEFEVFDSHFIDSALKWSQQVLKVNPVVPASPAAEVRGWLWVVGLIGIIIAGEGARRVIRHRIHQPSPNLHGLEIVNLRRFFLSKVLLWLAVVPVAGIIAGLALVIPLPKPILGLFYVGFIGGYGLLTFALYRLGRSPATFGKLKYSLILRQISLRRVVISLEFNFALIAILALFVNTGWNEFLPNSERLAWTLIFIPFTALGFWILQLEVDLITNQYPENKNSFILVILNMLLPFFLYVIVMDLLGSASGAILGLQGLLVLALVLLQGVITYRLTGYRWLTAILQALMLYLFILPVTALFKF
jgi:pimeloyl-ACP methyl ester carboxylesterase